MLGVLVAALSFAADEAVSVTATNDLEIRYRVEAERLPGFPDRAVFNYVEQVDRFNLAVSRGPWALLLQVDQVVLAANRYVLDGASYWERDLVAPGVFSPLPGQTYVNPEKVQVRFAGDTLTWQLGDFYAAFGTGIALNVARNVDIDVDTSIQGAHVLWRSGDWDLTALVGQANRQQVQQDNPNLAIRGDLRHAVAAVRAVRYGLGPASLGLHGVAWDFVEESGWGPGLRELGTTPDVLVAGATVEVLAAVDALVEVDVFHHPTAVTFGGAAPEPGLALYGSAVAYLGETTWQLEAKRQHNAERVNAPVAGELYEVAVAPTLEYERAITEDSSATVNSNDLYGARLRMDWSAAEGAVPYAALAVFHDRDTGVLHFNRVPENVVHGLVGAEVFAEALTVLANLGYRHDERIGGGGADRLLHGDLEVKVPVAGELHADLALAGELFRWGDNALQQADYGEVEAAFSLLHGSAVALTWFTDFTTNPLVPSEGNLGQTLYGAVEVQVKPTPAWTLRGFYGAYKAGIRCSGGQCRQLPGFEGARIAATGTF